MKTEKDIEYRFSAEKRSGCLFQSIHASINSKMLYTL